MNFRTIRQKVERRLARHLAVKPLRMLSGGAVVSFTFDDVPQSACREGRDVLEQQGCRATYYACGSFTDTSSSGARMHSRDDLLGLLERGHELGCHGYRHLDYQTLSGDEIAQDLSRNRDFFTEMGCASQVENFAYPYGCVSPSVKSAIGREFNSARGVWRGLNRGCADLALLRAEPLYQSLCTQSSLDELIDRNAQSKGWLIFFTHGVVDQPDRFGCTPALLDYAVRKSLASGAHVMPINRALRRVAHPGKIAT